MSLLGRNALVKSILLLVPAMLLALLSGGPAQARDESIDDITIAEPFREGAGPPVGKIQLVQGKAVIIHTGERVGYLARARLPLFRQDTLRTFDRGRLRLSLNDGSIITIASDSRLTISRSVYNPAEKERSSFIDMGIGKVRFWIKKMVGFDRPEFKVKTRTAILGVRGSDFIVRAGADFTEVTALDDTRLEVVSLAALAETPVLLTDFEQTVVEMDAIPSQVIQVRPEEVEQLIMEMGVTGDDFGTEPADLETETDRGGTRTGAGEEEAAPAGTDETDDTPGVSEVDQTVDADPSEGAGGTDGTAVSDETGSGIAEGAEAAEPVEEFPAVDETVDMTMEDVAYEEVSPEEEMVDYGGVDLDGIDEILGEDEILRQEEFAEEERQEVIEEKAEELMPQLPRPPRGG